MLSMGMYTDYSPQNPPPGPLGQLILECQKFARNNFQAEGTTIFERRKNDWAVKSDELPFELNVKGVAINRRTGVLRIELTGVDFEQVGQVLRERTDRSVGPLELRGCSFYWGNELILRSLSRNVLRYGVRFRTLLLSPGDIRALPDILPLVHTADLVFDFNCFRADSVIDLGEDRSTTQSEPRQAMEMQQRQQQMMITALGQERQMVMSMRFSHKILLAQKMLRMSGHELQEEIAHLKMTMEELDEVIGKQWWVMSVRRVQSEARKLGRNLTFEQAKQLRNRIARSL